MLFRINNVDISQYIIAGTYEVNKQDVTVVWQDANWHTRKNKVRTKVVGSFDVLFLKKSDYDEFSELLKSAKNPSGYYPCRVQTNNTLETINCNMFIDISPVRDRKDDGTHIMKKFTIVVEER